MHPLGPDRQTDDVSPSDVALLAEEPPTTAASTDRSHGKSYREEIRSLKAELQAVKRHRYFLFNRQRHLLRIAAKRERDLIQRVRKEQKSLQEARKGLSAVRSCVAKLQQGLAALLQPRAVSRLERACDSCGDWQSLVPERFLTAEDLSREEEAELGVPFLEPTADVVVCVHNALEDVKRCLASVIKHSPRMQQLVLVNDGSDEETTQYLERFAQEAVIPVELIHNLEPRGYTIAANQGLRHASGDYVVLLNSDTIVTPSWLEALVACGETDKNIGIVGPLSNAASWQSVPERFGPEGDWEVNDLPDGITPDDLAGQLLLNHAPSYPRVSLVNGFCYVIKRRVLTRIGYLDEETFPRGYGEENDYSLRAKAAGFDLAIADNAYVYHAKSKSFTHERRRELSRHATQLLHEKHGERKLAEACGELKDHPALGHARNAVARLQTQKVPFRVLYLMDFMGEGGGTHSVVQEVNGLCNLGVVAQMAIPEEFHKFYRERYPDLPSFRFQPYQSDFEVTEVAGTYDLVVATLFTSVDLLARIVKAHPQVIPAYYIQDYEPLFYDVEDPLRERAQKSYSLIPDMLCFAKTRWLCDTIWEREHVPMRKVTPSIDRSVYFPGDAPPESPLVLTAMVRPSTPRRSPEMTVEMLRNLKEEFGSAIQVEVFGCPTDDPFWDTVDAAWEFTRHGVLTREQVAQVLRGSSLFLDLSTYQAFGRTGLEAMACGSVALLPKAGGASEYARHQENALVVDTSDREAVLEAARAFLKDGSLRLRLRQEALKTAAEYSVEAAAQSKMELFEEALRSR